MLEIFSLFCLDQVDLPVSVVFYKWLLGQQDSISWIDLDQVDPGMSMTFSKLKSVLHQRCILENKDEVIRLSIRT